MKTPVLFTVFNRPDYTKKSFAAIRRAKPPKLYIAADGPRNIDGEKELCDQVRTFVLNSIDWKCEVKTLFQKRNSGGCGTGISTGISWFFEHEECGIIIEDDVVANSSFWGFCEELLEKYRDNKNVWSIGGDNGQGISSFKESYTFVKAIRIWGWGTWRDRWKHFSLDVSRMTDDIFDYYTKNPAVKQYYQYILWRLQRENEMPICRIDTWDYQFFFAGIARKTLNIAPQKNMINNIGVYGEHFNGFYHQRLNRETYNLEITSHPKSIKNNQKLQGLYDKEIGVLPRYPKVPDIKNKKVYLWGVGEFAINVMFLARKYKITAFLDKRSTEEFYGYEVKQPEEILNRKDNDFFIFIASAKYAYEMSDICKHHGLKKGKDFWSPVSQRMPKSYYSQ
ncbi:MAG: nucleotide-diphospho-sugar transferase [Chitinispirillia bacterium]|nr:nucleotide-diphospho-sugar transferase [Chitinispirillia bacterium]